MDVPPISPDLMPFHACSDQMVPISQSPDLMT